MLQPRLRVRTGRSDVSISSSSQVRPLSSKLEDRRKEDANIVQSVSPTTRRLYYHPSSRTRWATKSTIFDGSRRRASRFRECSHSPPPPIRRTTSLQETPSYNVSSQSSRTNMGDFLEYGGPTERRSGARIRERYKVVRPTEENGRPKKRMVTGGASHYLG